MFYVLAHVLTFTFCYFPVFSFLFWIVVQDGLNYKGFTADGVGLFLVFSEAFCRSMMNVGDNCYVS